MLRRNDKTAKPYALSVIGSCPPSGVLHSEVVVYRMAESLLAAEIPFSCLNRYVAKQELNLLKLSASQLT